MKNFLSFCVVAVRNVVLNENRKIFSVGFIPYTLDSKIHIVNGVEQIVCKSGYEDFFKMLELDANSQTDVTNKNLIGTPIKCNMIFSEGETFAITSLSTSNYLENCFVFSEGKNYSLEKVKELARNQKRKKLISQIQMYDERIRQTLTELSELEDVSLSLVKTDIDKIRNQH